MFVTYVESFLHPQEDLAPINWYTIVKKRVNCVRIFFKKKDHLNRHLDSIHDQKLFSCAICLQTFKWKHDAQHHKKTCQKETIDSYKCIFQNCDKEFSCKKSLKNHGKSGGQTKVW